MQERQHVALERDPCRTGDGGRRRPVRPIERTADGPRPRLTDLAAGDEIEDSRPEFGLRIARRHHAPDLVAVVDPAGVADRPVTIDEDHLRRDRRPEGFGDREVVVEADREPDPELPPVGLDLAGIVAFTDHAHEADALGGEFPGKAAEHRTVLASQRAGGMEKREAHGPAVGAERFGERNGGPGERLKPQVLRRDRLSLQRLRCGGIGG